MTSAILSRWMVGTGAAALCGILCAGCSTSHFKSSADKEVYRILAAKQTRALGGAEPFTIDQSTDDPLAGLPHKYQPLVKDQPGVVAPAPENLPAIISFNQAILIAIRNSTDYQRQKESLFLTALTLTMDRYNWTPQFSALLTGQYNRADQDEYYTSSGQFGVSELLATGGQFTVNLATDMLRYTTGDPRASATSVLAARFVQPLWRGAGQRIAQESLTQSERNVIYAVRSFARYHRTFAVTVATSYYSLLQQRSVVRNQWDNYQQLVTSRQRSEMLAQAGRLPEFQVDQTRQAELAARDAWLSATENYQSQLDSFKIQLGLRTDMNVDVDEDELTKLAATGIIHPTLTGEEAQRQALALRLDLMNSQDSTVDAQRKVDVAADGLGPDVTLVTSANVGSVSGLNEPANLRFEHGTYSAGLDVNLPLDRKAERNTYRQALISLDQSRRSLTTLQDNIKLQVREEWRTLQERKESYEIQRLSVDLAQRRVAGTSLLLEAGRVTTNDLLLAQSSQLDAQNALMSALVGHTIARLQLWRDVETLLVTPEGALEEKAHAENAQSDKSVE